MFLLSISVVHESLYDNGPLTVHLTDLSQCRERIKQDTKEHDTSLLLANKTKMTETFEKNPLVLLGVL